MIRSYRLKNWTSCKDVGSGKRRANIPVRRYVLRWRRHQYIERLLMLLVKEIDEEKVEVRI